jgi:hypothetical protein
LNYKLIVADNLNIKYKINSLLTVIAYILFVSEDLEFEKYNCIILYKVQYFTNKVNEHSTINEQIQKIHDDYENYILSCLSTKENKVGLGKIENVDISLL